MTVTNILTLSVVLALATSCGGLPDSKTSATNTRNSDAETAKKAVSLATPLVTTSGAVSTTEISVATGTAVATDTLVTKGSSAGTATATAIPAGSVATATISSVSTAVSTISTGTATGATSSSTPPWTFSNKGLYGGSISKILVHPKSPNLLFASNGRDFFESSDRGATWAATGFPPPNSRLIAIDPVDPKVLYSTSSKSTDGGMTWISYKLDGASWLSALEIFFSPNNPQTLYAKNHQTIYKSTDGGLNWATISFGALNVSNVNVVDTGLNLVVDPQNDETLYASTQTGVFKTVDGGGSWKLIKSSFDSYVQPIALNPATSQLYIASWDATSPSLARSIDGGATWKTTPAISVLLYQIYFGGTASHTLYGYGIDASDPSLTTSAVEPKTKLYLSTDDGVSWQALTEIQHYATSSWEAPSLAFDPQDAKRLYLGAEDRAVLTSSDGGFNWVTSNQGITAADLDTLVPVPGESGHLLVSGLSGVFRSIDSGASWTFLDLPFKAIGTKEFKYHPAVNSTVFVSGGGVSLKTVDGGLTWSTIERSVIGIAPGTPPTLYALLPDGLGKSENGGASFTPFLTSIIGTTGLKDFGDIVAIQPGAPNTLYVRAGGWENLDQANPFYDAFGEIVAVTDNNNSAQQTSVCREEMRPGSGSWACGPLAVSISNSNSLYFTNVLRGLYFTLLSSLKLNRSIDGGQSWQSTTGAKYNGQESGLSADTIYLGPPFVIDPQTSSTLYLTAGDSYLLPFDHLARSLDSGASWDLLKVGRPIVDFVIDASDSKSIYVLSTNGVYHTISGGN